MDRFEFTTHEDEAETATVAGDPVHPDDLIWDILYYHDVGGELQIDPSEGELLRDVDDDRTTEADTATSAEADLTYDQMTELARIMAPTPGIEGPVIGSSA